MDKATTLTASSTLKHRYFTTLHDHMSTEVDPKVLEAPNQPYNLSDDCAICISSLVGSWCVQIVVQTLCRASFECIKLLPSL